MILLTKIFEELQGQANAQSSANVVLLMNKLKTQPEFAQLLRQLTMPSDKYKAIVKFADLLGVPEPRFVDFIQNQQNISNG